RHRGALAPLHGGAAGDQRPPSRAARRPDDRRDRGSRRAGSDRSALARRRARDRRQRLSPGRHRASSRRHRRRRRRSGGRIRSLGRAGGLGGDLMTLVKPFRALRPKPEHAADVVAPPYDVVDTEEARALARGRPLSFLHVSRPEIDLPDGTDPYSDRVYAQGAANLERLVHDGVLVREDAPSFYAYRMRIADHVQTGLACVASVKAYEDDRIRKHELTRPDKETDRVRNIDALNAQTGPVLCAYRSNEMLRALLADAAAGAPLLDVDGPQNVRHTIWRISDAAAIERIEQAIDGLGRLYIADGHHRSAAAARIAEARRRGIAASLDASHEYFLTVAFPHDEMRILAYNRAVADLNGMTPRAFIESVGRVFAVTEAPEAVVPAASGTFGMYIDGRWYVLSLPPDE